MDGIETEIRHSPFVRSYLEAVVGKEGENGPHRKSAVTKSMSENEHER
jgi:hypothetical protein